MKFERFEQSIDWKAIAEGDLELKLHGLMHDSNPLSFPLFQAPEIEGTARVLIRGAYDFSSCDIAANVDTTV